MGTKIKEIEYASFWNCNELETITIPDSVTTMGSAFIDCPKLTTVYIGSGTKSINDFTRCEGLISIEVSDENQYYKSVDGVLFDKAGTSLKEYPASSSRTEYSVPDEITNIQYSAFSYAKNLKNIHLPETLTSIGSSAFEYCTSLEAITIPKLVNNVDRLAFQGCSNLKKVVFDNSPTKISDSAFRDCTKLSSIDLGDNITTIGGEAFRNCSALTSIEFPSSLTAMGDKSAWQGVFYNCTNLETVIFNDSPVVITEYTFRNCHKLKNVSLGTKIKEIEYASFWNCNELKTITIPKSVTVMGNAFIDNTKLQTIYGYSGTVAQKYANNNGIKFVALDDGYIGTNKTNTKVIMERNGKTYDLLTEHQIFGEDSTETVTVIVEPDWQGKPKGKILLSQGGLNYVESETGIFENICPAQSFNSDGNICVILVTGDGGTVEFQPIQLQITSTGKGSQFNGELSLFDDFVVQIPDSVPIINGEFGLSLGAFNTDITVDGNEFKVAIGMKTLEGKKDAGGKWEKEEWQNLKTGFNKAKKKITEGVEDYKEITDCLSAFNSNVGLKTQGSTSADVSVSGYIEGVIDENGKMKIFEGGIIVAGEIKYTHQGMVVVGVVPLYYEIGAGGGLKFVGGVKGYVPDEGVARAFTGSITPALFVEAGGGLGIPYVMTAGVKGKVELALEVALERVYQKLTVEGSANFQWKGPFNVVLYEKDFAKGTWYIYETGNPDTLLGSTVGLFSLRDMYNGIDLDSPVQLEDRSYILEPSEWIGGMSNDISLFAVDYTNKQLAVLEENTYKDAAPIIANMQGTKVMAWITDNGGREAVNKSMLVYSVYDEENGKWSLPAPVADDGTADYYPEIKDGYIVWQKANTEFDETASINDMSRSSEIYVAKWNGSGFDEAVRVTDNSTIDTKPTLAVNNDVAHIVWTTNTENNFMGTAGTNSILTCSFDGSNLSEQSTIASELTAITNMSASYTDALNVYYVIDTDNDYATVADRDIYSLSGTETTQVTSNSTLDSNPIAVEVNGEEWLFWYSEGNIMYKTTTDTFAVFDNAQSGITDDFDVITNGSGNIVITWTTVNDGGAEIQGVFYDGKTWSKDIQISELGENVKYPHGIMDENGTVTLAFNRTQKIATDDYYTDGQADLCTLQVTPSYDITVDDAMLGSYELIVGENSLLVDIANKGELSVATYTVEITDEKGNKLGEYVSETSLLAGEKKTIDVPFTIDETFTAQNIFATISAENIDEYNVDNNSTSVEVGSADAKIAGTAIGENKVSVTIKNAGFENVSGITVALSDATSTTPQTKTIETIASKEATVVEFDVDLSSLAFDEDGYGALTVTLSADADSNESNNETTINVSKSAIENYYEVKLHSVANTAKGCIINANVKNNLQYSRNATVIAAIYNSNNALVEVKMEEKELIADDYTIVDFSFEGVTLDKTQTIKLFVWEDLKNLTPIGIAKEYKCSDYIK